MSRRSMMHAVLAAASLLGFPWPAAPERRKRSRSTSLPSMPTVASGGRACTVDAADRLDLGAACSSRRRTTAPRLRRERRRVGRRDRHRRNAAASSSASRAASTRSRSCFSSTVPSTATSPRRREVTADGTIYTLSVRNNADDAAADWSGPGTVAKCGAHDLDRYRLLHHHRSVPGSRQASSISPRLQARMPSPGPPARTIRTTRSDPSKSRPRTSSSCRTAPA